MAEATPGTTRGAEFYAGLVLVGVFGAALAGAVFDVVTRGHEVRPLMPGDPAPAFSLPTPARDAQVSLADFGGRVVLVDFWATWCPPCLRELPELSALHTELGAQGFTVVAINREPEDFTRVRKWLADKQLSFPVAVDTTGVGEQFRVSRLPTTFLLDRQGRVVEQFIGYTEPARVKAAVMAALATR